LILFTITLALDNTVSIQKFFVMLKYLHGILMDSIPSGFHSQEVNII